MYFSLNVSNRDDSNETLVLHIVRFPYLLYFQKITKPKKYRRRRQLKIYITEREMKYKNMLVLVLKFYENYHFQKSDRIQLIWKKWIEKRYVPIVVLYSGSTI